MPTLLLRWAAIITVVKSLKLFLPQPGLMPSLGMILSEFPNEPYLAENWDDGAIQRWRLRNIRWILCARMPACDRRADGRTDTTVAIERCLALTKPKCSKRWKFVSSRQSHQNCRKQWWANLKSNLATVLEGVGPVRYGVRTKDHRTKGCYIYLVLVKLCRHCFSVEQQ